MKKLKKVTKFKRRVKFNVVPKILLVISCFVFVFVFAFSSYAYTYDPVDGNLNSDNLAKPFYTDITQNLADVTCSFDDDGILTMNGTSTGTGSLWLCQNVSITESGTYYFEIFNPLNQGNSTFVRLDNNSSTALALIRGSATGVAINLETGTFSVLLWVGASGQVYNNLIIKPMLVKGSESPSTFEPYGVEWYSSTQYNNYGSSKYSEGYNDGVNDTLDSLSNMEIGYLHSGVGLGVYDSTNSYLLYRGTLTTIDNVGTGVNLDWSLDSDTNIYYRLVVSFNDNYIFKNIKWTPNRFSYVSLTYGTNTITNVSYNGSYYGFFDLDETDISGYSSFTLNVKITNHSGWEGFNLYVDALNLNLADAQSIAEQNYNNGYDAGYEQGYSTSYNQGFSDGVSSIQDSNANYKTLIWTIASTPWESFKHIWSFDILGLNIANIVIGFIMVLLLIYLIKKIWR